VLAAASAIGCPAHSSSNSPSVNVFDGFIIIKALFWDVQLLRDQGRRQAGSWFSQAFPACGHAADGHPGIFYGHKPGSGRDCTIQPQGTVCDAAVSRFHAGTKSTLDLQRE
jgi:hypothetical protein